MPLPGAPLTACRKRKSLFAPGVQNRRFRSQNCLFAAFPHGFGAAKHKISVRAGPFQQAVRRRMEALLGNLSGIGAKKSLRRGNHFCRIPHPFFAAIAQQVEQLTCNEKVQGSIPCGGTRVAGRWAGRPRGGPAQGYLVADGQSGVLVTPGTGGRNHFWGAVAGLAAPKNRWGSRAVKGIRL